jgi:hypothetical protein
VKIKLHPGVETALRRLSMTETDVAEAIRDGEMASPQPFENTLLADMRISGTGVSYRPKLKEWVYRRPGIYLSDEFLKRCAGIPVIYQHPDKAVLDSDSFGEQVVGTMQLPYLKGEEVWGVARIYDRSTMKDLLSGKMGDTSPSVVFRDPKVNYEIKLENGETMLVEGNPSYVDHLAICERGVWSKGGDPTGIRVDSELPVKPLDNRIIVMADSMDRLSKRVLNMQMLRSVDRLAERLDRFLKRTGV